MTEYTYKTYGTACFEIEGGMYSIEEIEKMLKECKKMKRKQDEYLKKSIQPIKDAARWRANV